METEPLLSRGLHNAFVNLAEHFCVFVEHFCGILLAFPLLYRSQDFSSCLLCSFTVSVFSLLTPMLLYGLCVFSCFTDCLV